MKKNLLITLYILMLLIQSQKISAQCLPYSNTAVITASNEIVNAYYPGNVSVTAGSNAVRVGNKRGSGPAITEGDLLIVIQMQGARIQANLPDNNVNVSYGGNSARRGATDIMAGTYEYVEAASSVNNGLISLKTPLINNYEHNLSPTGGYGARTFQIVRVATYENLDIRPGARVNAIVWNGRTGGIVAIDVSDTLIQNGTINANARGFRGGGRRAAERVSGRPGHRGEGIVGTPRIVYNGNVIHNNLSNNRVSIHTGSYDGVSTYPGNASGNFDSDRGVGAPGNAGGAGFSDGGGAGGSNGGRGGSGGSASSNLGNFSVGGESLDHQGGDRLFMGGGGGSGGREDDGNDTDDASSGQPGGGIIIIRSNILTGSGLIRANGRGNRTQSFEGSGGGGAGGTILIIADNDDLSSLTIQARGGRGNNSGANKDAGGGGGGGGVVLLNRRGGGSFIALPSIDVNGGNGGDSGSNVVDSQGGDGGFNLNSLPGTAFLCRLISLPISFFKFDLEKVNQDEVKISWITNQELNNEYFVLERSMDALQFEALHQLSGAGTSARLNNYEFIDQNPLNGISYYRIKQVDFDGSFSYSPLKSILMNKVQSLEINTYPNPCVDQVKINGLSGEMTNLILRDSQGRLIKEKNIQGMESINLDVQALEKGIYLMEFQGQNQRISKKLIKR